MTTRSLLACATTIVLLACGGGESPDSGAATGEPADAGVDAAAPTDEAAAGEPAVPEVADDDQEAILQTGLLGEWQWVGFQGMDDSTLDVEDPSSYTLVFRVDGVTVQADCNQGQGSFDLDGSGLTFTPFATSMMACPPESLGDRYLGLLAGVRSWVIEDGRLFLSLMADGGIMEFRPGSGPA